jgi:transglutaminase-like putative cysteine protease
MTFGREKRLLLGLVALGVALPLPLNDALEWPALAAFVAAVALFLRRAASGSERWLSNRALNLLGLAYLPILVLDILTLGPIQPVRPVLHLILFGVAAKLWSLRREKDKWQTWIGIFFLFLASMATSTHPSVLAYLVAFLALTVVLLARFVHLHVAAAFGGMRTEVPPLGMGRAVAGIVAATALLSVPLFALLPRVRSPFVVGPGTLSSGEGVHRMGFSDDINLDLIGRLRENREVAMRLRFEGRVPPDPATMRFKAGAYEEWAGRTWKPAPGARRLARRGPEDTFQIAPGAAVGRARIELEPLRSPSLVLPVESVAVEAPVPRLDVSRGGVVSLGGLPGQVFEYTALLGRAPVSAAEPPAGVPDSGTLSRAGVTPEMEALAAQWAQTGSPAQRAGRIWSHLRTDYAYTTDLVGRGGASPIQDFLFRDKRGHCEYFASAMVLLLRAQGIPARLVTGFFGAEYSPWEGSYVVRQSNAHAWVEAWLPEQGWTVFDPTPDDGLPLPEPTGLLTSARQAWDALVFRWDRWVISYDFEDQVGVLGGIRGWWSRLLRRLTRSEGPEAARPTVRPTPAPGGPEAPQRDRPRAVWPWVLAALVVAAAGAALLARRRAEWSAARAYLRLRQTLAGAGLPVPDSLAPLALAGLVARRLPPAAAPASRVVGTYLRESFAGREPSASERSTLHADLAAVAHAAHAARRRRRAL